MKTRKTVIRRLLKTTYRVHPKGAGGSVGVTLHPDLGFAAGETVRFVQLLDLAGAQVGAEMERVPSKRRKPEVKR